jgi:hypothetical protein
VRQYLSPSRLQYDLLIQLVWSGLSIAGFVLRLPPIWWLTPAFVLIGWQLFSAGELRWRYHLVSRDRILLTQLICLALVPFLLTIYGILSWLPALTVAGVHLLCSRREYAIVRRRAQRFWDL